MMDPLYEEAQIFVRPYANLFHIHDAPTVLKRNVVNDESMNKKMICVLPNKFIPYLNKKYGHFVPILKFDKS